MRASEVRGVQPQRLKQKALQDLLLRRVSWMGYMTDGFRRIYRIQEVSVRLRLSLRLEHHRKVAPSRQSLPCSNPPAHGEAQSHPINWSDPLTLSSELISHLSHGIARKSGGGKSYQPLRYCLFISVTSEMKLWKSRLPAGHRLELDPDHYLVSVRCDGPDPPCDIGFVLVTRKLHLEIQPLIHAK